SNNAHGLPLSAASRRRAVLLALSLRPNESDRKIALHCGVSPTTVGAARASLSKPDGPPTTAGVSLSKLDSQPTARTGRDGRTIDTTNIGKGRGKKAGKARPEKEGRNTDLEGPLDEGEDREEPGNNRKAFLVRADTAIKCAQHSGWITRACAR